VLLVSVITSIYHVILTVNPTSTCYFRVNNMQHVIGADFNYIIHCNHNRRSFVYSCLDMYRSIGPESELTAPDLHGLYCLVCPDLGASVVQEAALYVSHSKTSHAHYPYGELQISFFFQIVFYEWLRIVSPIFHSGDSRKAVLVKANVAVAAIEERTAGNVDLHFHLPMESVSEVLRGLAHTARGGEVSFKNIIKALVLSPSIKLFLLSKKK
jgi:hypothetical protein